MGYINKIKITSVAKRLYLRFQRDEVSALSAQVAYSLILSFFPFLIFFLTLMSYTNIVAENALYLLARLLPRSVYLLIMDVIKNVMATRSRALLPFGMAATVLSSSWGVMSFIRGFNKAYHLKETRPAWKLVVISVLFTVAFVVIIAFSFILVVFGEYAVRHLLKLFGIGKTSDMLLDVVRFLLTLIILQIVFILIYYFTPNCKVGLKDILPGAVMAAICWIALSAAFSFYVNNYADFSKTYGSLGVVIALLLWLYWSSMIVLTGGELNAVLLKMRHKPLCKRDEKKDKR